MLHRRTLLFIGVLLACASQGAGAQCRRTAVNGDIDGSGHARKSIEARQEFHNRTVLLDLELTNSGAVRSVAVSSGAPELRIAAIKAAARRKYDAGSRYGRKTLTVAVSFPAERGSPQVREIAVGVSGCVYGGSAPTDPVQLWLTHLLSQPTAVALDLPPEN